MMKLWSTLLLLIATASNIYAGLENTTCKKCHPIIFSEYQTSMHSKSSIFKDDVHKAVWDKHPAKAANRYLCAKCHTPSDHALISGKHPFEANQIQRTEPISCQTCHTIENVEEHTKTNKNVYTQKKKYFFSAKVSEKGKKIIFKEEKSLFGLFTRTSGSPYHSIDYSNENFYNAKMCLGCHDHKQNGKKFTVCDMQIKQGDSKETCISCHMPQRKGSFVNLHDTKTHAFHGMSIHKKPVNLSKYITLSLTKKSDGFEVTIHNKATHTLFPQPLRLNQLRVDIERNGKIIPLATKSFVRIIGREGKPAMPWLATEILKDTTIKALETRKIPYDTPLHKGDNVVITFGYYLVNPKAAKKLGIKNPGVTKFIILTKKRVVIE